MATASLWKAMNEIEQIKTPYDKERFSDCKEKLDLMIKADPRLDTKLQTLHCVYPNPSSLELVELIISLTLQEYLDIFKCSADDLAKEAQDGFEEFTPIDRPIRLTATRKVLRNPNMLGFPLYDIMDFVAKEVEAIVRKAELEEFRKSRNRINDPGYADAILKKDKAGN